MILYEWAGSHSGNETLLQTSSAAIFYSFCLGGHRTTASSSTGSKLPLSTPSDIYQLILTSGELQSLYSWPSHGQLNDNTVAETIPAGSSIMAEKQEAIAPAQDASRAESLAEGKIGDAAEDIVHAAEAEFTPEQYRKLLWKIDLVILPFMWVRQ